MFRYFSCRFKLEKYKLNCARIALWRDFAITNVFTIETSSYGYINNNRDTIPFTPSLLEEFGKTFGRSLLEYCLILDENMQLKRKIAKKLTAQRKKKTIAEILGSKEETHDSMQRQSAPPKFHPSEIPNPNEPDEPQSRQPMIRLNSVSATGNKRRNTEFLRTQLDEPSNSSLSDFEQSSAECPNEDNQSMSSQHGPRERANTNDLTSAP
jgi:hypothetical protein